MSEASAAPQLALGDNAARQLANATKTAPILSTISPRWLTHLLQWLPVVDDGPAGLVLPALTLGIPLGGFLAQVTRDEFDAALRAPFVLSALSRGARPGEVRRRQVLRHAALPGIALSGWGLGSLISGAVVVEVIFSRQGIGQVLVAAVTAQDLPLVIGVTFVVAAVYVLANILSDLASVLVDPRLRHAIGRTS